MKTTKHILCLVLALLFFAAYAEDTDCGALITTSTIEATAKVENLTGANAGTATITINNNSGTANSVTVYNAATMDTALSGKASTGDVTALQARATSLESATNDLAAAVAAVKVTADGALSRADGGEVEGAVVINGGATIKGGLFFEGSFGASFGSESGSGGWSVYKEDGKVIFSHNPGSAAYTLAYPAASGTFARIEDIPTAFDFTVITNAPWITSYTETDPTVPSWAKASSKPSYSFSEIGSTPTTLSGYGITDVSVANGTITIGSSSITPVTTETDPVWTSEKSGYVPTSRKVAGMALSSDITLKNLSIVGSSTTTYNGSGTASVNQTTQTQTSTTQNGTTGKNLTIQVAATSLDMGAYYIKIGTDGKPHLMLRQ